MECPKWGEGEWSKNRRKKNVTNAGESQKSQKRNVEKRVKWVEKGMTEKRRKENIAKRVKD